MFGRDPVAAEIAKLKREARGHYEHYCARTSGVSCGLSLTKHIRPDVATAIEKFNACMDRLAEIDPSTPKARL